MWFALPMDLLPLWRNYWPSETGYGRNGQTRLIGMLWMQDSDLGAS